MKEEGIKGEEGREEKEENEGKGGKEEIGVDVGGERES